MIVCKVCGTQNEAGASFCGSCGSFLEWSGEAFNPDGSPVTPAQPEPPAQPTVPGPPAPGVAVPGTPEPPPGPGPQAGGPAAPRPTPAPAPAPVPSPAPAPQPTAPGPAGGITCPVCGEVNDPSRTFCRRCATELAPPSAPTEPVAPEPPRARGLPPVAVLGGIGAVAVVGLVAVALLLSRGTPPTSGAATASPSGPGPVATASGAVVAPSEAPAVSPAPSVPTGEIVFAGDRNGDRDLYVWDAATGQVRLLLKMAGNQTDPSWSPDRSKVVYRDTKAGLRIINADGTPASPPDFTHHAQDLHPAWSPDGSTIVFATNRSPLTSLDIYSRPADDNQVQITSLANSKADDWDPQWSPDGTTIVFASRRQGDAHLFLMNADGSSERLVDLGPGIYDDPTISPDGQWLAFTRRDNAKANKALYIARIDGSDMRRMTNVDVNEHDVSWSPDGRYLAVVRGDQGSRIIVLEVATGAEVTSFGIDGGRALVPDWR